MSGRIPQSFINDLLGRVDIVGVIGDRVQLKKAGKDHQARCPFHDEKTPSFTVSQDKQFYYCFGCSASGTALTFLMEYERLPFVEAVETLAALAGVEVPREHSRKPERDNSGLYDLMQKAERHFRQQLKGARGAVDYLKSRGLTGAIAKQFGIGFAPDTWDGLQKTLAASAGETNALIEAGLVSRNEQGNVYDRFRGRVMFPIRDTRGRVIGFGGRRFGDGDGPKYLNSPETPIFHKSEELYGLFEARKSVRNLHRIVVVEGYLDVIALAQYGVPNAVATLGTASGEPHYRTLYRYTEEVVCCFDGDQAGRRAAWRALENALATLTEGRRLKFMFLPEGEDPDTLVRKQGADDFVARLDNATPAIEYLFGELAGGFDLNTIDDRAKLASLSMPYVDRVPAGALKDLMLARVQELTGLKPEAAPPSRGAGPRAQSAAARRGTRALADHLLAILLQRPRLLQQLSADQAAAIVNRRGTSLFGDVVKYLAGHPDADSASILGRWSGDPRHEDLVRLCARRAVLTAEAETAEFLEGVKRLIAAAHRYERKRLREEMRAHPSTDKLARFWSLKLGAGADGLP